MGSNSPNPSSQHYVHHANPPNNVQAPSGSIPNQENKQTTEIVELFPHLSKFGVMKHLDLFRDANRVQTRSGRRVRIHSLNATPIGNIAERWISKYDAIWSNTLLGVRDDVESAESANQRLPPIPTPNINVNVSPKAHRLLRADRRGASRRK